MVFSSYVFVFLFLPIVLIGYFLLSKIVNKTLQHSFLVIASLFFYAYFNITYLFIIIASIFINYILAKILDNLRKSNLIKYSQFILAIGILFNIGMLGYYKYYDFFIDNMNVIFGTNFVFKNIILPLGISFFTFQQFSFLISVYKNEEKVGQFTDYCLFVSFFPQLVAGPIVLYSEMMPQFTNEHNRFVNFDNIAQGIYMFSAGLFKKVVIADTIALFVNNGFGLDELDFSTAWFTAIFYTLQIYFDFSGYSDMAIGLGKMFNIDIPQNFISPYKSESITEFWRRWHITLGRALSTYVYIPLGGNRKGKMRTCLNLFLTFLVSGLWHGSAWTFVLWGALHGVCVVIERLFKNIFLKIPKTIKKVSTFLIVNFLWVLFRSSTFTEAANIYTGMFDFKNIKSQSISVLAFDGLINFPNILDVLYLITITITLSCIVFFTKNSFERLQSFSPNKKNLICTVVLLCISIIHLSRESIFIYFNF